MSWKKPQKFHYLPPKTKLVCNLCSHFFVSHHWLLQWDFSFWGGRGLRQETHGVDKVGKSSQQWKISKFITHPLRKPQETCYFSTIFSTALTFSTRYNKILCVKFRRVCLWRSAELKLVDCWRRVIGLLQKFAKNFLYEHKRKHKCRFNDYFTFYCSNCKVRPEEFQPAKHSEAINFDKDFDFKSNSKRHRDLFVSFRKNFIDLSPRYLNSDWVGKR